MSFRGNDKGKKGFLGFSMGNRSKEKLEKASSGSQAPRNTDVIQHKWSKLYAALLRRPVDNDLLEMANEFASVAVPGPHIKTRAIGSLTHDEVLGIFPWKKDTSYNWNLRPNEMTPVVPAGLDLSLDAYGFLLRDGPNNEARSRSFIDPIIFHSWSSAKRELQFGSQGTRTGMKRQLSDSSAESAMSTRSLRLQHETWLELEATLNNEKVRLNGKADYSLWYGSYGEMECNVAIVEGKKIGLNSVGVIQCHAYMSVIHSARKRSGRKNTTVYGVATDGETFEFLRMSANPFTGETMVARSVAIWGHSEENHYIVSILRRIYREAHSLPATRPGSIARGHSVAKRQRVSISDKDGNAIDTDYQ